MENPIFLGFILGLAYMAFELPNSFFKRKLGIKPGESALNKKYFFVMLDKIDSAFGVALVYYLLGCVNFSTAILLLFVNSLTHILMSLVLVSLKIKSSF
ncbi:CDP-archaeol synthase [Flavobacterium gilvum]|uniref:CDP-archaeol synthase n=1 Tax=Flavobacterium gilvum TaxID=1492737 RepID=UPI0012E02C92|nr:CDP-archaeol synthase [Flavobacterium gilvum]